MLKNIRLHIEKDEEKQSQLEQKLAASVLACQHKNINSFARNIPSLLPIVQHPIMQNHSLFCNKFGEINIVDYGIGRTLYGFHPEAEILRQVTDFIQHAPYIDLHKQAHSDITTISSEPHDFENSLGYLHHQSFAPCPDEVECLVVLGCGLGMHILDLLKTVKIKNLIIYEPELQYFQCSSLVNPWYEIFALAQQQKCQLFIQVQKDGRDIINDINELNEHQPINGFHLYQHYNHPVFNSLLKELSSKNWDNIKEYGITFTQNESYNHYVPVWTPDINLNKVRSAPTTSPLLAKNLNALKQYFPNIYAEFKDYQPKIWLPIINDNDEINVVKADSLTPWYSDNPKQDCEFNYANFNEQPHKDGLVLGYNGTKLAHYLHYQFVKQTEELLAKAEEEVGALPDNVASIIMFGIGVGYQIETLLHHHTVEKLFLCEPNTDFFYASLFAIDWQQIFETIDKTDARIYLNIGDDGSHLFRDLLGQFHSIGPYILNNTYFYQSYYNASLNTAIAQLREQLQIVISMGEYFDHAYYGIEHTKEGMRRNYPLLVKNPSTKLSYYDKEVPVFIVGNGPSLDLSIEAIKEWREQVIVISCGTALQALHRNGITPDFHAEIEQNRSTYDWAVLTGDLEYLKNITLISCNGIHPDTCNLYKDVMIAFKEGESSTVSALTVLGQQHFEVLQHAFPTVSNFVCDLVSIIGFNHIYLMGVDLGFIDVKHHHSKSSGYYQDDGNETYNYAEKNNTSLVVAGNFRPVVNTKHEFKISRQIIEQVTQKKTKDQTFYNCSDGAKISGTNPLRVDDLLIMTSKDQKQHVLTILKQVAFSNLHTQTFIEEFENKFSDFLLFAELNAYETLLSEEIKSIKFGHNLINKQKELLFNSYKNGKSLLFYYLYGTVNYANAVLLKLLFNTSKKMEVAPGFNQCLALWLDTVSTIKKQLSVTLNQFDTAEYYRGSRELAIINHEIKNASLLVVSNSNAFLDTAAISTRNHYSALKKVTIISQEQISMFLSEQFDFVIYYNTSEINCNGKANLAHSLKMLPILGRSNTIYVTQCAPEYLYQWCDKYPAICFMPAFITPNTNDSQIIANAFSLACSAIKAVLSGYHAQVVIPKYIVKSTFENLAEFQHLELQSNTIAIDYGSHLAIYLHKQTKDIVISKFGTRGKYLHSITQDNYILQRVSAIDFAKRIDGQLARVPLLYEN